MLLENHLGVNVYQVESDSISGNLESK
jgi:hypothetical protein